MLGMVGKTYSLDAGESNFNVPDCPEASFWSFGKGLEGGDFEQQGA